MNQIIVSNISVDIVKKDIKNVHLAVYPPNWRVRLATPLSMNEEAIRLLIVSRFSWIKRQQTKFLSQERETQREFVSWESHFFLWKRYLLNIIHSNSLSYVKIRNKKYIDLHIKNWATLEKKQQVTKEWYRNELKKHVKPIIEKWTIILWVEISNFWIKHMKTKWWSCNIRSKRIWLNLELAKKDKACIEYVIVHELIHLIERKHSDKFKEHMDKHIPKWRLYKEELNKSVLGYF